MNITLELSEESALWLLQTAISDLSELCYCATWLVECGHTVWELIEGNGNQWGMCGFEENDHRLNHIRALRDASGMWFCDYEKPCTVEEFAAIHEPGNSGGWRIK